MEFPADATKESMIEAAMNAPEAAKFLKGMQVVKQIVVPGRIINLVVKPE